MKHPIALILIFLLYCSTAYAWPARVVAVADGDTITVEPLEGGDRIKIRLHGIDAPERKQPYGESARIWVSDMVLYKTVDIQPVDKPDRYGRVVAKIYLADGHCLQALLVQSGLAWVYDRYCPKKDLDCRRWRGLQQQASDRRLGLWVEEECFAPWEWRKKNK